jgi:hypothetical protein
MHRLPLGPSAQEKKKMAITIMRHSGAVDFGERPVFVAADGWAYERPTRSGVWRYPHDGGTQTDDASGQKILRAEIPDTLWAKICAAHRVTTS